MLVTIKLTDTDCLRLITSIDRNYQSKLGLGQQLQRLKSDNQAAIDKAFSEARELQRLSGEITATLSDFHRAQGKL